MIFKEILSHPDFLISDEGLVKANPTVTIRTNGRILTKKERIINQHASLKGYMHVRLSRNGYGPTKKVHRLVAEAFVPNPNGYKEVNHIDGDKANNKASNLEWCTRSENVSHAFKNGLRSSKGERNSNAKLVGEDILKIRQRKNSGENCSSINKDYPHVSLQTIWRIANNQSWIF